MIPLSSLAMAAVLFGDANVAPGTILHQIHDTTLDLELQVTLLGRSFVRPIHRKHHQALTVERLPTGIEVQWTANRHQTLEPGHTHDRILPVVGHRYRRTGAHVTRSHGAATAEEAEIVQQIQVFDQLKALRSMVGHKLEIGDQVPAGPMFAGLMADAPGTAIVSGTLQLRSVQSTPHPIALFDVSLTMTAAGLDPRGAWVDTVVVGAGVLTIDVESGCTLGFSLDGTVTVRAHRRDLKTHGTGSFHRSTTIEYR